MNTLALYAHKQHDTCTSEVLSGNIVFS